jgi:hypothetical protein
MTPQLDKMINLMEFQQHYFLKKQSKQTEL